MNVSELRTELILLMYDAIKKALQEDDALPDNQKKYFVRDFKDWKDTVDLFEAELNKRNVDYERIIW